MGALEVPLEFRGLHAYEASCSGAKPLKPILGSIVPSFGTLRGECRLAMEPRFYRLTMLTMRACACKWKKHIICPIHCNTCTNPILLCCHDSAMDIRLRPSNPQKYCYTGRKEDHSTRMKKKKEKIQQKSKGSNSRSPGNLARFGESGAIWSWHELALFCLICVNMTSNIIQTVRHIFVMLLTNYLATSFHGPSLRSEFLALWFEDR